MQQEKEERNMANSNQSWLVRLLKFFARVAIASGGVYYLAWALHNIADVVREHGLLVRGSF